MGTQLPFHSSPSPGGMETTCCRQVRTWIGTKDGLSSARKERPTVLPSSRLLIPSSHQRDLLTSRLGCLFRMFTKLEVSELRSSPWRCTTSLSPRPPQETTLGSTSRTCPCRISREDMSPLIPRTSQLLEFRISLLRSLSSTTLVRFPTDTVLSLIATQRTLLASLLRSRRRLTVVLESLPKTTPSLSNLVTLLLSYSTPASPCVWSHSLSSHLWEGSLSVT